MAPSNMYKSMSLLEVVESHSCILLAIALVVGPLLGSLPSPSLINPSLESYTSNESLWLHALQLDYKLIFHHVGHLYASPLTSPWQMQ